MNIENLIEQRVSKEISPLKKAAPEQVNSNSIKEQNYENLNYPKQFSFIEHLPEFKQIRVDFKGESLTCWSNGCFSFVIKYECYPFQAPIIQFHQSIRHHQIIPGTGKYCLPEFSTRFWKQSTRIEEIIFKVIQSFHQNPQVSDYPVDLSIVQLYMKDEREYSKYVEVCKQKSLENILAIQLERDRKKEREKKNNQQKENEKK